MTSIPLISDGQPVTYEFLNLLVGAVNKLSKPDTDGSDQDITITGGTGFSLPKSSGVSVVIGTFTLNFGSIKNAKQSTAKATPKFSGEFKDPPLVFVSAVDPSSDTNEDISYLSLTVTQTSATQFTCKARRMVAGKDSTNKDKITVNYIAIGRAT